MLNGLVQTLWTISVQLIDTHQWESIYVLLSWQLDPVAGCVSVLNYSILDPRNVIQHQVFSILEVVRITGRGFLLRVVPPLTQYALLSFTLCQVLWPLAARALCTCWPDMYASWNLHPCVPQTCLTWALSVLLKTRTSLEVALLVSMTKRCSFPGGRLTLR